MAAKKSKGKKQETVRKSDAEMHAIKREILDNLSKMITKVPEAFCEHIHSLHQAGDRTDGIPLMNMIYWCAKHGWPLPQWAADAFISAFDKVHYAQVGSWDDAFGPPYPKGTELNSVARKRKSLRVYVRIRDLKAQDPGATLNPNASDDGLFAKVGKEFGLAPTQCKEVYYKLDREEKKMQAAGRSIFPLNPETPEIT